MPPDESDCTWAEASVRVGEGAPDFSLQCVDATLVEPRRTQLSDYAGRWLMLLFYPRDFSFVCPTELTAFSARRTDFGRRNCDLLGVSVDTIELHQEWLTTPPSDGGLGPLQFPLASDPDGEAARAYGVWVADKQVSTRGLFIIDPEGVLQYSVVHALSVGRRPDEVLRVLEALQTGGLCPANWTSADGTIDPEQVLQPGRVLGHYRIRRQLGGGSFGTVFAAWDLRLERMVALKVLKRNVLESRKAVLGEARAAARLNHPHVCTVYAVEEEDGLPVIAMEYLDGKPLSDVLADGLQVDQAVLFAQQIASGLAVAHQHGVVHGDLKPANIMITVDAIAKILDFGLAQPRPVVEERAVREEILEQDRRRTHDVSASQLALDVTVDCETPRASECGMLRGTPAYMSPEQARGLSADATSDVFTFGLLLYELLTGGRRALPDIPLVQLLDRLQDPDLGEQLASQVAPIYRPLVAAMLAYDADQRPAMVEVADQLAGLGDN